MNSPATQLRRSHSEAHSLHELAEVSPPESMRRNRTFADFGRMEEPCPASRRDVIQAATFWLLCDALGASNRAASEIRSRTTNGIATRMAGFISDVVNLLQLPNSCIVAALIYMQRAASSSKFSLDLTNWQPTVLSAFIVATKLAFDEPVWNEDFADGLRTDVPLSQISRWESDFLEIIEYNANVKFAQYAALCFELQARYETLARPSSRTRGGAHFFTYLMRQPTPRHAPLECRRPYRLPHGPAGLLPAVAPEYPPSDTHPRK